ncbi:MAG: site-2 protease family protein [Patescibacteria group bacterium]
MDNRIFLYIIIILSAVIHEYSHGWIADRMGDKTARYAGRLTLNPLAHMDLWGTVIIPLFLLFTGGIFIGWAKPVPYNPYNIQNKHGSLIVGLAGPASNFIIAIILGLLIRFNIFPESIAQFIFLIVTVNVYLALFNLIPVPPLDGSKVFGEIFPSRSSLATSGVGIIVALLVAFLILPPIAGFVIKIIIGI